MINKHFIFSVLALMIATLLWAQPPDDAIPPAMAVNMLNKGMLFEPQAGNVDIGFSAPYKPEYGQILKDCGFKSVRIRYQGNNNPMMIAIKEGPPYDAADDALLDETENIIDDLLNKNLAVVLTFYGLTNDNDGDLEKMVSWWGYVANRFKDKSHRLIFNLFVEPIKLVNNNDHHRIMDYYEAITTEIRQTNPDRILIYYKINPENHNENPYGPGTEYFMTQAYNPVPADAGIYYMWDFHALKSNTRDNIRLVEQAWEYQDWAKQAVWSGAWFTTSDNIPKWRMTPMAINTNRRFINRGVSYAYLMMFDGHTAIYDAQNDHNDNGILDEWAYPGLEKILVSGPDIWWNLLSNPGFEKGMDNWEITGNNFTVEVNNEEHRLYFNQSDSPASIRQDITLALKNNGTGKYNVLCRINTSGTTKIKFIIKGVANGNPFNVESDEISINNENVLINTSLQVNWNNVLEQAYLFIEVDGDACNLDKTGLTMFYSENPQLNTDLWPGERIHNDNYSTHSTSGIDVNIRLRSLMKQEIAGNNSAIITIANEIHNIRISLEDRLRELIGPDYAYTSDETQYRTGGYSPGSVNHQYNNLVKKYIGGKDDVAYELNQQLIGQQNLAVKYFVINNMDFRILYYDVYRDYPEFIKNEIPIDTSVVIIGNTLKALQNDAAYRWLNCDLLLNPVLGASGQTFMPHDSGRFAVEISKNGFVLRSACHKMTNYSAQNELIAVNTTKVYPNPANSYITIEPKDEHMPFTVNLLNMEGKKLNIFRNLPPSVARIKPDVPKGNYLLEVILEKKKELFKIHIQ